jgi:hypothetical protein
VIKTTITARYLSLCLIGFLPALSGCLSDFSVKADVEDEQTIVKHCHKTTDGNVRSRACEDDEESDEVTSSKQLEE